MDNRVMELYYPWYNAVPHHVHAIATPHPLSMCRAATVKTVVTIAASYGPDMKTEYSKLNLQAKWIVCMKTPYVHKLAVYFGTYMYISTCNTG